jgi:hypothetical protein
MRYTYYAAESGGLEILQWLRNAGCPWDTFTCMAAARGGKLEILQWLRIQGCPWDDFTCKEAVEQGNVELLQWAIDHGCPEPMNDRNYVCKKNALFDM